jgi:hypothetical protein
LEIAVSRFNGTQMIKINSLTAGLASGWMPKNALLEADQSLGGVTVIRFDRDLTSFLSWQAILTWIYHRRSNRFTSLPNHSHPWRLAHHNWDSESSFQAVVSREG